MQHPSFTADRNQNYNDFYGVLATVNPYCLVLSKYSILSQTYKILRRVSEKAYWGMKVKLLCIIILRNEKKKEHNDGLLFLLIKNDVFDPRDNFFLRNEKGLGAITLETRLTGSLFVVSWKKCPLINQSVSSRPFVEDSYGASFRGRNSSQFRRSSTNVTEKPGNLFDSF